MFIYLFKLEGKAEKIRISNIVAICGKFSILEIEDVG